MAHCLKYWKIFKIKSWSKTDFFKVPLSSLIVYLSVMWERETRVLVMLVPMFAPITIGMAILTEMTEKENNDHYKI